MKLTLIRLSSMPNRFGSYAYEPVKDSADLPDLVITPAGKRIYSPNKLGANVLTEFEVECTPIKRNIGGIEKTFYNLPNPNLEQDILVRESINENLRIARLLNKEDEFSVGLVARLAGNVTLPSAKKQPISSAVIQQPKAEVPAKEKVVDGATPAVTNAAETVEQN